MSKPYEVLAYDSDLYHRALTGRGEPITNEEILRLLDDLDVYITDYRELEAKYFALKAEVAKTRKVSTE